MNGDQYITTQDQPFSSHSNNSNKRTLNHQDKFDLMDLLKQQSKEDPVQKTEKELNQYRTKRMKEFSE